MLCQFKLGVSPFIKDFALTSINADQSELSHVIFCIMQYKRNSAVNSKWLIE